MIFGADPKLPRHIGGGNLWREPETPEYPTWARFLAHPATTWAAIAVCFFFVGLTFWLSA